MPRNAFKGLDIANSPGKMPNFGMLHLMVYVECVKGFNANRWSRSRFTSKPCSFTYILYQFSQVWKWDVYVKHIFEICETDLVSLCETDFVSMYETKFWVMWNRFCLNVCNRLSTYVKQIILQCAKQIWNLWNKFCFNLWNIICKYVKQILLQYVKPKCVKYIVEMSVIDFLSICQPGF